jgi:hypothetical protein
MAVCRRDPCGVFCILMTYGAVLYADYVVIRWIILQTMQGMSFRASESVLFNDVIFVPVMLTLFTLLPCN